MQFEIVGYKKYVEIEDFRPSAFEGNKIADFSFVVHPEGQKILGCRYLNGSNGQWWAPPQKEITKGEKKEYLPLVSYKDKAYGEALKLAVLGALQNHKPQVKNEKNSNPRSNGAAAVPGDTSIIW